MAASSSSIAYPLPRAAFLLPPHTQSPSSRWVLSSKRLASPKNPLVAVRARRSPVVAGAKKKKSKADSHSFAPRPDEATGPFPEAVLLKKKTAKEDGRVLPEFADADEEKLYEFLSLQLESDLNVERMRHYEVVYLIHEDHVDKVDSVVSKVQDYIREKKGRIWRLNDWGLRTLAYKIQKATKANYILMNFEMDARFINDLKSMLDKDERIIRHLVMKQDKAITEDCPSPPEFHTLRSQEALDDEGWDDEDGDGDEGDDRDGVVIVNGDDDELDGDYVVRKGRTLKSGKIAN